MPNNSVDFVPSNSRFGLWGYIRNALAFCLLGLSNNFAYVVMLSAAHDMLTGGRTGDDLNSTTVSHITIGPADITTEDPSHVLSCNKIGTGVILIVDIFPALVVKGTAPFYVHRLSYRVKVLAVVVFAMASFLLVGLSCNVSLNLIGVACASMSSGLGEVTFLAMLAFYDLRMVRFWAMGTGIAGVAGAMAYAALTTILSPRNAVITMVIVPVVMLVSFFVIRVKRGPCSDRPICDPSISEHSSSTSPLLDEDAPVTGDRLAQPVTFHEKLRFFPCLLKFMIPLSIVYCAEYFINQGLHELLYFNNIFIDKAEQYRWYQVAYQVAVMISRTAGASFPIATRFLWILPLLQAINLTVLTIQVFQHFIPFFWLVMLIIFWEGLLGGLTYVKTFYNIRKETPDELREFSLGVASIGDTFGIAIAGLVTVPVHDAICQRHIVI